MKVITNIRAGAGQKHTGVDSVPQVEPISPPVVVYYPPVVRCVGI